LLKNTWDTIALFFREGMEIIPGAPFDRDVTLGARYDKYSDVDSATSPRVALLFDANASNAFKLMYGEAFRTPNFEQLALNTPGRFIKPDSIGSETISAREVAWVNSGDYYNMVTTVFRNDISDVIAIGPIGDAGEFSWQNSGDQTVTGLEWEMFTDVVPGTTVRLNHTSLFSGEDNLPTDRYASWAMGRTGLSAGLVCGTTAVPRSPRSRGPTGCTTPRSITGCWARWIYTSPRITCLMKNT